MIPDFAIDVGDDNHEWPRLCSSIQSEASFHARCDILDTRRSGSIEPASLDYRGVLLHIDLNTKTGVTIILQPSRRRHKTSFHRGDVMIRSLSRSIETNAGLCPGAIMAPQAHSDIHIFSILSKIERARGLYPVAEKRHAAGRPCVHAIECSFSASARMR